MIPPLDTHLKQMKPELWKDVCVTMFNALFSPQLKNGENPKCLWADEYVKNI